MSYVVVGQLQSLNLREADLDAWAHAINTFQHPATGLFTASADEPHHTSDHEHTTAFSLAALKLIGRRAAHPLTSFRELAAAANASRWAPWIEDSEDQWDHRVSGVLAGLSMSGSLQDRQAFRAWYFKWLDAHPLNASGFAAPCAKGRAGGEVMVSDMTCWAHIAWQYRSLRVPWLHPERMVDVVLHMQNKSTGYFNVNSDGSFEPPGNYPPGAHMGNGSASSVYPSCHQLDGLYVMTRSSVLANRYRWGDVEAACGLFLASAAGVLNDDRLMLHSSVYMDSHGLNGALQAVAECAKWFPHLATTRNVWNASLDFAPFM